jgi:hypothetical protein
MLQASLSFFYEQIYIKSASCLIKNLSVPFGTLEGKECNWDLLLYDHIVTSSTTCGYRNTSGLSSQKFTLSLSTVLATRFAALLASLMQWLKVTELNSVIIIRHSSKKAPQTILFSKGLWKALTTSRETDSISILLQPMRSANRSPSRTV